MDRFLTSGPSFGGQFLVEEVVLEVVFFRGRGFGFLVVGASRRRAVAATGVVARRRLTPRGAPTPAPPTLSPACALFSLSGGGRRGLGLRGCRLDRFGVEFFRLFFVCRRQPPVPGRRRLYRRLCRFLVKTSGGTSPPAALSAAAFFVARRTACGARRLVRLVLLGVPSRCPTKCRFRRGVPSIVFHNRRGRDRFLAGRFRGLKLRWHLNAQLLRQKAPIAGGPSRRRGPGRQGGSNRRTRRRAGSGIRVRRRCSFLSGKILRLRRSLFFLGYLGTQFRCQELPVIHLLVFCHA